MSYETIEETRAAGDAAEPERDRQGQHRNGGARLKQAAADRVRAVREQADELTERAERLAAGARDRADDLVDAIDRTRLPERTRNYPLAALGIAAGVGFLLAGSSEHRVIRVMKSQLRGLLIAGVIASLRDEAEGLIRDELTGLFRGRGRG